MSTTHLFKAKMVCAREVEESSRTSPTWASKSGVLRERRRFISNVTAALGALWI
jgi:hypothetical protein